MSLTIVEWWSKLGIKAVLLYMLSRGSAPPREHDVLDQSAPTAGIR